MILMCKQQAQHFIIIVCLEINFGLEWVDFVVAISTVADSKITGYNMQ